MRDCVWLKQLTVKNQRWPIFTKCLTLDIWQEPEYSLDYIIPVFNSNKNMRHSTVKKHLFFPNTAWNVSIFGVFLVRVFPHLNGIRIFNMQVSGFSLITGKYRQEKLQIMTLITLCKTKSVRCFWVQDPNFLQTCNTKWMNLSKLQKYNTGKDIHHWWIIDCWSFLKRKNIACITSMFEDNNTPKGKSVILNLFLCRMAIWFTIDKLVHWHSKLFIV